MAQGDCTVWIVQGFNKTETPNALGVRVPEVTFSDLFDNAESAEEAEEWATLPFVDGGCGCDFTITSSWDTESVKDHFNKEDYSA